MSDDNSNPTEEPQEIRRESDEEKSERLQALILGGSPIPSGRKIPTLVEPPAKSEEDALRRVADEIASLKSSEFYQFRAEPLAQGLAVAATRGPSVKWDEMSEEMKFETLGHWIRPC